MAVERTLAAFAAAPATPPNTGEALVSLDGDAALLEMLLEQGQLVRLGGEVLFRPQDVDAMMAQVCDYLAANAGITMAQGARPAGNNAQVRSSAA